MDWKKVNETNSSTSLVWTSDNPPEPDLIQLSSEYDGYFKIQKAVLRQPTWDGSTKILTRYIFERGDAVAVLLHDPKRRTVVLVRQYRCPAALRQRTGWLLEIVAGSLPPHDDPVSVAVKEVQEETGIENCEPGMLGAFFLSPGGSSERCFLFEAAVDSTDIEGRITGEKGTDEDVRVEVYRFEDAMNMVYSGRIVDAKTIIALQYLSMGRIPGWDNK